MTTGPVSTTLPPAIVFDDPTCNSLGVVRAFGRRGVETHLVTPLPRSMARHSRYVHKVHRIPCGYDDAAGILEFLRGLAAQLETKPALIPTGDQVLIALVRHKRELDKHFYVLSPEREPAETLVDKARFYRAMLDLGVSIPKTFVPDSLRELDRIAAKLNHDAVIKPARTYEFWRDYGRKNFIFRNFEAYQSARKVLEGCQREIVVQEYVPGDDVYMVYVSMDRNGRPLAVCGYDKIRQYAGTGCFCASKKREELLETSIDVLRRIGFHGIAEPEFKRDSRDGLYKLLEINSRTSTQNRLPWSCGLDVDYAFYQYMVGNDGLQHPGEFEEDVKWICEPDDIASFLVCRARGETNLRQWLGTLKGKRTYAFLAKDDLVPSLRAFAEVARILVSYVLRRKLGADSPC